MAGQRKENINRVVKARWKAMRFRERLLLRVYFLLTWALPEWLIVSLVKRRAKTHPSEESAERARERIAGVLPARPDGRVVWLQSIGPGDSAANLALMEKLHELDPDLVFLVTTRTVAAQGIFRKFAERAQVLLLLTPHDGRRAVVRFVKHWRPSLAVFGESELWPNTIDILRRRNVPMTLVNGQFNGRLGRSIGKLPALGRWVMAHLDLLHVFSAGGEAEAKKWTREDCDVIYAPNLKLDADQLQVKPDVLKDIRAVWGDSPVFFGASVAENEIETLIRAHDIAAAKIPGLKLLLAPRWKEEAAAIHAVAKGLGHDLPRRSHEGMPGATDTIFLADSYGEFGVWLEICFAAFMGHTLFGGVGHNPYEPILHQRQIVSGAIPAFLATDYQYLADIGLCHVADTPEKIAVEVDKLWRGRELPTTGFEEFVKMRGFSTDIARRILVLAR
ncbi:glycosyltransferase N-terminal domain-containing protein [Alisedimentitalea sp. MJ-SS2]|uniref:3-deoxy-D-manno-octulosonic acid transferase n=1 Tax=Aliisedimentitalea sp. MJ-SS2 TaxID=3049795 RepID=UPI00290B664C|nr:glycosyltransferase N-terminal domain-containing protein [Alisedimentitalea sp. MJ-SS2]MDU8929418.1 glycosyltransferase N-terminal domain-containing protein [Alisedimentitalea sp. MJ-SS2]